VQRYKAAKNFFPRSDNGYALSGLWAFQVKHRFFTIELHFSYKFLLSLWLLIYNHKAGFAE
jgi:hypothetical protein